MPPSGDSAEGTSGSRSGACSCGGDEQVGEDEMRLLDYHDVLLRRQDLDLLERNDWLNDQIIAFHFEYLSREAYPGLLRPGQLLLVPGSVSYLLANALVDDAAAIAAPLQLQDKELAIFAVNDNPYVGTAGGGSHWSLLAYTFDDNTVRHFDSCSGSNRGPAEALARRLRGAGVGPSTVTEARCPQQRNGYDCGVYVLGIASVLCEEYAEAQLQGGGTREGWTHAIEEAVDQQVSAASVAGIRRQLAATILRLRQEQVVARP